MTKKITLQSAENDEENEKSSMSAGNSLTFIMQKMKLAGNEPTYNSDLLRESRINQYKPALEKFKNERIEKGLNTNGFDIDCFYFMWLKAEVVNCESKWQSKTSNSDNLEIFKYKSWVKKEMKRTEIKIQSYSDEVLVFNWNHNEDKAEIVHGKLIEQKFIDNKTTLDNFKSAFGLLPVSPDHKRIIWELKFKGLPHKQALRDFLTIATGETILKNTVLANFSDTKGNPIDIGKGKEHSKYRMDIERLFL